MINYYLLTKPGIILGNLITLAAGFFLASQGHIQIGLFLATLLGLALVIASACVFNNYIDRNRDKYMKRTQNRALVIGLIPVRHALLFGTVLGLLGVVLLLTFTNVLATFVAAIGFCVYIFMYSMWKSHTVYGTAIGSVAGAIPPVVGYCAVSNQFDAGAFILFMMLVLWQMPHFFSIAMFHYDDYSAAKIPVLPIVKGAYQTKIHSVLYIISFLIVSSLLTFQNYTGYFFLIATSIFSLLWLALAITGFSTKDDKAWGRDMFRLSLWLICTLSLIIPFDVHYFP